MRRLFPLCLSVACESGTWRELTLTVPAEVAEAFTAEAPGLVVTDLFFANGTPLVALCGQREPAPRRFDHDQLFSCKPEVREQTVRAWVDPAPSGWTAEALCAAETGDLGLDLPARPADTADTGASDTSAEADPGYATSPEPTWAQGQDLAEWKGDATPCGGSLRAEVTLRFP